MGTAIIFALVALLAVFATIYCLKSKNLLGLFFAVGTLAVFGFFSVATVFFDGLPDL